MDMPPATTQGRRASAVVVVDRNLDELCACLDDALSSTQRSPDAEARLRDAIEGKTVFLRSLLAAEAECHGGARPERLAEAEARFAVLAATFDRWARRAVVADAPEPVEEVVGEPEEEAEAEAEAADYSGSSRSTCSCTDSCQEATEGDAAKHDEDVVEARDKEGASDVIADAEDNDAAAEGEIVAKKREAMGTREEVTLDAVAKKRDDTDREAAAETRKRAVQRRWWRQSAAGWWCGAAGVVAVVAVGLAVELAAVAAHHNVNVYVVPT